MMKLIKQIICGYKDKKKSPILQSKLERIADDIFKLYMELDYGTKHDAIRKFFKKNGERFDKAEIDLIKDYMGYIDKAPFEHGRIVYYLLQ